MEKSESTSDGLVLSNSSLAEGLAIQTTFSYFIHVTGRELGNKDLEQVTTISPPSSSDPESSINILCDGYSAIT
jgi:hypothetical protein